MSARKTRSDAKVDGWAPEVRADLEGWLFEGNCSYTAALARLKEKHGLGCSIGALTGWYQRRALQRKIDRISASRRMAEALEAELKASAPLMEGAMAQLILQRAFELSAQDQWKPGELAEVVGMVVRLANTDVDRRKVALLEEKAREAKAKLTQVVSKGGLSPETLKQIEEAAGLL
jgi:hypothetical protein